MKRLIPILLVIATLVGIFSGCKPNNKYLTRSEWIVELASCLGMDSSSTEESYFADVHQEDESYPYIQSCADWGVLPAEEEEFLPNQTATVEFALETAILASGINIGDTSCVDYALEEGIIKNRGFLSVRGRLTESVAGQIIDWSRDLYLNGEFENRSIVEYKEDVIDLNEKKAIKEVEEGVYVAPSSVGDIESGDIIMMPDSEFPDGVGVKVENVTTNRDGTITITTVEPEIEELLENLDVATEVVWQQEDIQLAEGVDFAGGGSALGNAGGETAGIVLLGNGMPRATNLSNGIIPDINLNVDFTKGTISLNPEWDLSAAAAESFSLGAEQSYVATDPNNPDSNGEQMGAGVLKESTSVIPVGSAYGNSAYKNQLAINAYKDGQISLDELKKELNLTKDQEEKNPKTMENKFKAGYQVVGGLKISDIKITAEAKYNVFSGLKASLKVDYDFEASVAVKGYLTESLNVMTIRVPIATGITIDVKFYLCLDVNGEISVKVVMEDNSTKYTVDGFKAKKTTKTGEPEITKNISAQVDFGPKIALELCIAGYPLVDLGIKAAVRIKASAQANYQTSFETTVDENNLEHLTIKRQTVWTVQGGIYLPIVTLEANVNPKSIGNKLKLTGTFTLLGENNALKLETDPISCVIWSQELELIGDFVDNDPTEATVDSQTDASQETVEGVGDILDINTYYLNLEVGQSKTIEVVTVPEGYSSGDLIWTSSDTDVAKISGNVVTAKKGGVATITVRTADGQYYKQCSIIVNSEATVEGLNADELQVSQLVLL